ncbi:MAG: hypothetical protein ACREEM_51790, partial [Blastocatellia bacterium]
VLSVKRLILFCGLSRRGCVRQRPRRSAIVVALCLLVEAAGAVDRRLPQKRNNDRFNQQGGNHGGFPRASTQATLMFAGGARTGIPRASRIIEPYDSLSFAPTVFALMGLHERDVPPLFPVV